MADSNGGGRITYRDKSIDSTQIQGVTAEYVNFSSFDAERGRLMSPTEVDTARPVTVIGWQTADRLFGTDIDPLDKIIQIEGVHFRVVGVSAKRGSLLGQSQDEFAVIPLGQFQMMFGSRRSLSLTVQAARPRRRSRRRWTRRRSRCATARRLKPKQPDNFGMFTSDTILDIYHSATNGIFAVLVGVVALSLVVGGIVIMNIMLMVVTERTREIGLRKALGARAVGHHGADADRVGRAVDLRRRHRHDARRGDRDHDLVVHADSGGDRSCGRSRSASASPRWSACSSASIRRCAPRASIRSRRCERNDRVMAIRIGLFREVVAMAFDTVRTNKMRSALTVLGVVIGITSIVGMTAMIRGFDQSLRDMIGAIGPNTIFVQRFGITSFANGAEFTRAAEAAEPVDLRRARARGAGRHDPVRRHRARRRRPADAAARLLPHSEDQAARRLRHHRELRRGHAHPDPRPAASSTAPRCSTARTSSSSATPPYQLLFEPSGIDPIGKIVRVGSERFEVVGVFDKRPAAGGFNLGQDDFVVIPYTAYQRIFGLHAGPRSAAARRSCRSRSRCCRATASARPTRIADVERVMRIRHGLKLDEPNDFDMLTQDAFLKLWDQISQGTFFALIVISSIALMVGGIGVMAIMSISVTERTREIGVRKALGARRAEILFQFLMEAAFLTSVGGLLGIVLGTGIGWAVHLVSGFPISLPWWSFAIGLGFSASVGIFFGMYPAFKASRLDPIEALRYE